jgi:hypothetical protein
MYLKDAAKAGREWHFKHAIVYLDKALNKIEQQRPQLKRHPKLQQAIDDGMCSVTIRGVSSGSRFVSDIELKRKEIRKDLRNFSEKLTKADPLLKQVFFEQIDKIKTLDGFFHKAVQDVPVTHDNALVLLALVTRCALHRWATTVYDWKKRFCCTMCSSVPGGCGALKRGVWIAGEAVAAAAREARKGIVKWCVGTLDGQSAENLQCIKQYVLAPEKNQCRFAPFYSSWCAGLLRKTSFPAAFHFGHTSKDRGLTTRPFLIYMNCNHFVLTHVQAHSEASGIFARRICARKE